MMHMCEAMPCHAMPCLLCSCTYCDYGVMMLHPPFSFPPSFFFIPSKRASQPFLWLTVSISLLSLSCFGLCSPMIGAGWEGRPHSDCLPSTQLPLSLLHGWLTEHLCAVLRPISHFFTSPTRLTRRLPLLLLSGMLRSIAPSSIQ